MTASEAPDRTTPPSPRARAVAPSWGEAVAEMRASLAADFERNPSLSQRITLAVWRLGQATYGQRHPVALAARVVQQVANAVWFRGVMGAEIPTSIPAGPGLWLPHSVRGVIMHHSVQIGAGCTIYHHTTLGLRGDTGDGPVLGDGCYIGAGAQVLGDIVLAEGTKVGANAVLTRSTEPGGTYVGVPARLLERTRGD